MGQPNRRFSIPDVARSLFLLNALVWLILGIFTFDRLSRADDAEPVVLWVVGILMFGNTGAMLLIGLLIGRQRRLVFAFALAVLLVNILLTFTDQFGLLDFLTLLLDLFLFAILSLWRDSFLPERRQGDKLMLRPGFTMLLTPSQGKTWRF